jgi:poly(beta-D-mannuronate) C5 epimerase
MMTSLLSLIILLFISSCTTSTYATSLDSSASEVENPPLTGPPSNCVTFDSEERNITITCKTTNLTEIANQLKDPSVLVRDKTVDKGWILNAGLTVAQNAVLYINSTDTSWLKIIGDGNTAYPILISGSLKIDSTKVTSWNPTTNNYTLSPDSQRDGTDVQIGTPRPYITINADATGTTDISNSEIAYLGYESGYGGGKTGLRYEGSHGSIIRGNNIHGMYFAFYSKGVGGLVLENNHIHDNIHYGFDPHTGTHDMIIRSNLVHDNGGIGIICSLDCYNVTIENNTVYNNTKMGIMLSRNMYDSLVRYNTVSNEDKGIVISESHDNQVYNNTVSTSGTGIDIDQDSIDNIIHDNVVRDIADPAAALFIEDGEDSGNSLYSNTLINSSNGQEISLDQGSNVTSANDTEDENDEDDNSSDND